MSDDYDLTNAEALFEEFARNLNFAPPPAPDIRVRLGDLPNSIIVENFPIPAPIEREFVVHIPITAEQAERLGAEVPT